MSLPEYAEYKDSGVEWLGELPSHWTVRKFRHSFQESSEKIDGNVIGPMLSVSGYRGIEIKDYDDENRRRTDEELQGYRIVRPGQLVVNTMWLNYAGLGVSVHEGHVSPAYRAYSISEYFEPRFVHHMMRSGEFVKGYAKFLTGIRPNSLQMSRDDLMEFRLAEPPREEQAAIADFLDRETAKIDALIAEQEALLALLAEKRQATISHAVTRGLDPDVPMKDSGIAWLGEVPAHWGVRPLKAIVSTPITDGPHETPEFLEEGVPFVSAEAVSGGAINFEKVRAYISHEDDMRYSQKYKPQLHDIYMVKSGATTGVTAIVEGRTDFNIWSPLAAIRCNTQMADPYYVLNYLRSKNFQEAVALNWSFGIQQNIGMGVLGDLAVVLPPLEEQREIARHLDSQLGVFPTMREAAETAVTLLRERRSALIAAAVTGKIDVRGQAEVHAA